MDELYEKLTALQVDDVDGVDQLFAHVHELAQLKHRAEHLWVRLRTGWKARKVPMLPALDKAVDRRIAEVLRGPGPMPEGEADFELNRFNKIVPNHANSMLALDKMGVTLRYDNFNGMPMVAGLGERYDGMLDDNGMNRLWIACEQEFGFRPSISNFTTWVTDACFQNGYHPVLDYLDGLTWDGKNRIDTWLIDYCEAEDNPYTRAVGAIWLTAGVRRVRKPGTKFDELMIWEGEQGGEKSTSLEILARREDWFTDSVQLNASEKEMIESTSGVWICEIGELQGMRKGDINRIKAQLSRKHDRARMAYARLPSRVARQSIYAGSMNPQAVNQYLTDTTGNRRFWPIPVGHCDVEGLRRDVDQLWAEASLREASGASIRLQQDLWPVAAKVQSARTASNAFADTLGEALGGMEGYVLSSDAWKLLRIPIERRDANNIKFGEAWARLGWSKRNWRIDGRQANVYVKGSGTQKTARRIVAVEDSLDRGEHHFRYADALVREYEETNSEG